MSQSKTSFVYPSSVALPVKTFSYDTEVVMEISRIQQVLHLDFVKVGPGSLCLVQGIKPWQPWLQVLHNIQDVALRTDVDVTAEGSLQFVLWLEDASLRVFKCTLGLLLLIDLRLCADSLEVFIILSFYNCTVLSDYSRIF